MPLPSYRYTRDIKPEDTAPNKEPEYTRGQKAKNWWHYHWYWVAAGLAALGLIIFFIVDSARQTEPDLRVAILSPANQPIELADLLAEELGPLVGDLNGDGQAQVVVDVLPIDASMAETAEGEGPAAEAEMTSRPAADPYGQMAGVARLIGAFETGEVLIFLADPAQAQHYQDLYSLFGTADGALAAEGTPVEELTVDYASLAALAGAELAFEGMEGPISGRDILKDYRVGVRPLYGTKLEDIKDGPALWRQAGDILAKLQAG